MTKHYVVRVVHRGSNNSFRIKGYSALFGMVDLLMRQLREGEIDEFGVKRGK
jgi:hypothetical protein